MARTVTVEGVEVVDILSRRRLTSVSVTGTEKDPLRFIGLDNQDGTYGLFERNELTDNARRPGALRPDVNGDNKAAIQIIARKGGSQFTAVGEFTDFILTDFQEQDAEKVSVVETFGAPHIFAAGRFTRKFMFSGVCRTTGTNYQSQEPTLFVPQSTKLRVFYDKYLRATQQARTDRFTRIIVDGDAFDGYITTMNSSRTSQNEHFSQFSFTMVGIRRSHLEFESEANNLLNRFKVQDDEFVQADMIRAQAELEDALGTMTLSARVGYAGVLGPGPFSLPEVSISSSDHSAVETQSFELHSEGSTQVLEVVEASGIPGVGLGYLDTANTPVHQSLAPAGESKRVGIRIFDYARLYRWVSSTGESTPQTAKAAVSFRVKGQASNTITLNADLILSSAPNVIIKSATFTHGASKLTGTPTRPTYFNTGVALLSGPKGVASFDSTTKVYTTVQIVLASEKDGSAVPDQGSDVSGVQATVVAPWLFINDKEVSGAALARDIGYISSLRWVNQNTEMVSDGVLEISGYLEFNILDSDGNIVDLSQVESSPFVYSNTISIDLGFNVTLPGILIYGEKTQIITGTTKFVLSQSGTIAEQLLFQEHVFEEGGYATAFSVMKQKGGQFHLADIHIQLLTLDGISAQDIDIATLKQTLVILYNLRVLSAGFKLIPSKDEASVTVGGSSSDYTGTYELHPKDGGSLYEVPMHFSAPTARYRAAYGAVNIVVEVLLDQGDLVAATFQGNPQANIAHFQVCTTSAVMRGRVVRSTR